MSTIGSIAAGDENFSILVAAVNFIDSEKSTSYLDLLLDTDASLTVIAPTNAAFGQLATDLGFEGDNTDTGAVTGFLTTLGADLLETVVLYHIADEALDSSAVQQAGMVTTVQGGMLDASELPTLGDKEPDLINASISVADISADNGFIHVIDRVLLPVDLEGNDASSITGLVLQSGEGFDENGTDFDMLREAVIAADLAATLDSPEVDLTVFAPTDAAFVGLANTLGYAGADEAGALNHILTSLKLLNGGTQPVDLLTEVLTYHVADESLQSSQVIAAGEINTLQGGTITLDGVSLMDADDELADAALDALDIQASNGVVHVIDGVMIPVDVLDGNGANDVDFIIATDEALDVSTGKDTDYVAGSAFADEIMLGGGADVAFGAQGDDMILGGFGADLLRGNNGHDMLGGGRGADTLYGGNGMDVILGARGADMVWGGKGADTLFGGQGNDMLSGGKGNDTMSGGMGNDVFDFNSMKFGNDTIRDFMDGDMLDLSDINAIESMDDLTGAITQSGDNAVISIGDSSITLLDVSVDDLSTDDFIFA